MALPPTIPTSFVPKQPVQPSARQQKSGSSVFVIIGAVILGLSILLALSTFGYQFYLTSMRDAKAAEIAEAQRSVDIDMVEGFIRLRNRLNSVQTLLDQHIGLSEFFNVLEAKTLATVRFNSLAISVNDDRSADIEMEGVARTFNALAAQSSAIASEKRIKRAIFSDIKVNTNGTVAFSLTATVDSRLITSADVLPGIADIPTAASPAQQLPATMPTATATTTKPAATSTTPAATTTPSL